MPDLPNRAQREKELAAALLLLFTASQPSGAISAAAVASAVQEPLAGAYGDAIRNLVAVLSGDTPPVQDADAEADRWANEYAAALGREISDSTHDLVARADDIDAVFGRKRAEMIAATEITRAITAAEAWLILFWGEAESAKYDRVWHTEQDGLVCPVCRPLNGKPETIWGGLIPAGPPAHPHCRCWLDYHRR